MIAYRDVLLRLLTDVEGIYRRHSEVLGRFEAVEDRFHAAKRELETLDATGAKTPAAVEILDGLLTDLDVALRPPREWGDVLWARSRASDARDRARLNGEAA